MRAAQLIPSGIAGLRAATRGVFDAVLPQTCPACGCWLSAMAGELCPTCAAEVAEEGARPACPRCGRVVPAVSIHGHGCSRCRSERFWNVAGVARVGRYTPALRALVHGLKYRGEERNAAVLAKLMAGAVQAAGWPRIDVLVPVPMHWLRRRQRPCDHARLLAGALSGRLKSPLAQPVWRRRYGPSQTQVGETAGPGPTRGVRTRVARFENVHDAFGPRPWWMPPWRRRKLAGRTVCIVDNLLVSGATVTAVSRELRRLGARRIYAVVAARPPAPGDPRSEPGAVEPADENSASP
jgi:predicted amidophosphoribosyltransferase